MKKTNMDRTSILFELRKRGVNAARLATEAGLSRFTFYSGLERPYPRIHNIIAEALAMPRQDIWPQFYDCEGNRRGIARTTVARANLARRAA